MRPLPRPWSVEKRLRFVEFRLRWEGQINRRDLIERFGISVPQASNDLRAYLALAPGNAFYDPKAKTYRRSAGFAPALDPSGADRYLDELAFRLEGGERSEESWIGRAPPAARTPVVRREVSPEVLGPILQAIRDRAALRIRYQSLDDPVPAWRWIAPHALATDAHRWHVRARDEAKGHFRDFVLARCLEAGETRPTDSDPASDADWNETIAVVIAPNPRLSSSQRRAVAADYGMTGGRLTVEVRRALLFYLLTDLRLDFDPTGAKPPRVRPVVCLNEGEIMAALAAMREPAADSFTGT
jgi:hypothetical protein